MFPIMRILPMFAFFLLIVAIGTQYNPPDIVVWAMLIILLSLGFYAGAEFSLPNWYVAMILRIRKVVLRF
jgi:hypothetical protein